MLFQILFVSILAFSFTYISIPLVNNLGLRFSLVDKPNKRKQHNKAVVRIGGISILIGFLMPIICLLFLGVTNFEANKSLITILIGSISMFILGFIDDIFSISFLKRLFIQILVASYVWSQGIRIEQINITSLSSIEGYLQIPTFLSYFLTTIWIVGIINAFNWLDGLDGLAAGIGLISTICLGFASFSINMNNEFILILALAASCSGFLIHNFNPAKIFMGDGGSYLIGSVIAIYSLFLYNLDLKEGSGSINFLIILLILFLPIVDMVYVVCNRLLSKRMPFFPDRSHLHHRLLRAGFSHTDSVIFCYLVSLFFSTIALGNLYPNYRFLLIFTSSIFNLYFLKVHFNKFVIISKKLLKKI